MLSTFSCFPYLDRPSISQIHSSLLVRDADLKSERLRFSLFFGFADLLDISVINSSFHLHSSWRLDTRGLFIELTSCLFVARGCASLHSNVSWLPKTLLHYHWHGIPHNKFLINSAVHAAKSVQAGFTLRRDSRKWAGCRGEGKKFRELLMTLSRWNRVWMGGMTGFCMWRRVVTFRNWKLVASSCRRLSTTFLWKFNHQSM